jgi:hypothetical protein
MKAIVLAALIVATFALTPSLKEDNGKIAFEYDAHPDLPIGIKLQGEIDPSDESNNKVSTFLKLANYFIPLVEAKGKNNDLQYWATTCIVNTASIQVCLNYGFQLTIGWRVYQGGYTAGAYNITYVPFAEGWAAGNATGFAWPIKGEYGAGIWFVRAYAPIGVQLYTSGQVCFGGYYYMLPTEFGSRLISQLKQCKEEIIDDLVMGNGLNNFVCGWSNQLNFTHLAYNFTDYYRADFLNQRCFG